MPNSVTFFRAHERVQGLTAEANRMSELDPNRLSLAECCKAGRLKAWGLSPDYVSIVNTQQKLEAQSVN